MRSYTNVVPPWLTAFIVCIALLLALPLVWTQITIPVEHTNRVIIILVLISIALFSLVIYLFFNTFEGARKLAEAMTKNMLTYSHELFSELYRNSPVPYMVLDAKGIVESANFASARLFDITIDSFNGMPVFDHILWDESPQAGLVPQYFSQGKFVNDVEVLLKRPDGALRWAMLSLFSFKDPTGAKKGMLTLVDITRQKQVDKAKTEFVSLASHQLRTPISAMRWNIELLETSAKHEASALQNGYIEKISRGLARMDALVEDFLSASKLELGTLTVKRETFDLNTFFASVLDEYRVTAERRRIMVETNFGDATGEYVSDAHLLNMVVSNILGNAIKYTPEGGVVRAVYERTTDRMVIEVTDTGIGIPEEDQSQIFTKLFRASNAQTKETDGTGLGLYIVREAVRMLGGDVTFVSRVGVGTTFTIVLPP